MVVIKNGTKYDKIALLKELLARCSVKFIPICCNQQSMNAYFLLPGGPNGGQGTE